MQNKGAIRLLAILLALACIYQLSFTWKTNQVKSNAKEYANGDAAKEVYYLDSISGKEVYNFIGLRKYSFRECQQRELNLGLDLKGGMSVILEVSVVDVVRVLAAESSIDSAFDASMALAQEMQKTSQESFVRLFGKAFDKVSPGGRLAYYFYLNESLKDRITNNSTNSEVLEILEVEANSAISNSFNIIRNRIDRFGVAQPNIQQLETHGRIMVELPGINEPDRVRNILQSSAKLEFWETYENDQNFMNYLMAANKVIKELEDTKGDTTLLASSSNKNEKSTEKAKLDTGGLSLLEEMESGDSTSSDTTLARQQQMKDYPFLYSLLIPNLMNDNKQFVPGSTIGLAHIKDIQKINAYLEMKQVRAAFPPNVKFYWSAKAIKGDKSQTIYELNAIKVSRVGGREGKAPLDGSSVVNARDDVSATQATAQVDMTMDGEGGKVWARMTRENLGKCIAIVLDDKVYSSPRVQSEIKGGNSQITGDFTQAEAKDLANVLKSGKLPAPARIIQEAVVGPTLGKEGIDSGFNSFFIAFVIVLLYMIFYYNKAGIVADIALTINMFFLIGVLSSIGAVLTLPGIAGIVLTIGMSVDANVIIYERIREELRAGKGLKLAVKDGYQHAFSAIIDGNMTTVIAGVVLYLFGTGPIRGFATTLVIGILTTLFTAILLSRVIFVAMLDRNKNITFGTKWTDNIFYNTKIKFIEWRKWAYIISIATIVIGITSIAVRGINWGVDFTGGRTYIVRFDQPVNTAEVTKTIAAQMEGETPSVITFGDDNQIRVITKYKISERSVEADKEVETKLYTAVLPLLPQGTSFDTFITKYRQQSEKVGPTIARDIKIQAIWALVIALILMFIYIVIRFKKWEYGLGAVISLFHDAFIVISVYSIFYALVPFNLEADQSFIAAILTVIGYSINDTVIIFDRIRENSTLHPKLDRKWVFDTSMNSTLGRTFNTSFTTLIVLIVSFLFGGDVTKGFIFAMIIGIGIGTYSSVFVASPIAYDLLNWSEVRRKKKLEKA